MPRNKTSFDILLSCPGDLNDQIDIVRRCINRFNETVGRQNNVVLELKHWSTSSYPKSGQSGQETLNQEFVEDCDAAIAIFWSRFGTPTDKYGSGTEEEIQIMLDSHKQVFMYFCTKNLPYNSDLSEVKRIRDYRRKYEKDKLGLYRCYDSDITFEMILSQDLMAWFIDLQKGITMSVYKKIEEMNVNVVCAAEEFAPKIKPIEFIFDIDKERTSAKILIDEIKILTIPTLEVEPKSGIIIPEKTKQRICNFDPSISAISEKFFYLGELHSELLSEEIIGCDEAKEKYKKIIELNKMIMEIEYHNQLQQSMKDLNATSLIVHNQAGIELQNVTIKMYIDDADFFDFQQKFPIPNDEESASYVSKNLIEKIFSNYSQDRFYSPEKNMLNIDAPILSKRKTFERTVNRIFCYDYVVRDKTVQLSLSLRFIKNNEKIYFPTPLYFQKKESYKSIKYEIICSNFDSVKTGEISLNS